jgi:hypothetical protein
MSDWTTVVRNKSKGLQQKNPVEDMKPTIKEEQKLEMDTLWKEINVQRKQKKQLLHVEQIRAKQMEQKLFSQQPWRPFQKHYKMASEDRLLQEEETLKYADGWRPLQWSDFNLTRKESVLVEKRCIIYCCECCDSSAIKYLIKRPFTHCGFCYCCVGDNPDFDKPNLRIYVDPMNIDNKNFVWISINLI